MKHVTVRCWRAGRLAVLAIMGVALGAAGSRGSSQVLTELVPIDAPWRYDDSNADLGTAWREVGYDDSGWASGPAAFGFPLQESIPLTTIQTELQRGASSEVTPTFYFRTHFSYGESPAGVTLIASNIVDDGAVFYLNGTEVGRVFMPEGQISFGTFSLRADDIGGTRVDVFEFTSSALVQGDNVLAVELHQGGPTSSDAVFAGALYSERPFLGPVVIREHPTSQEALQGASVTFSVLADGTPPYWFQWFKNGEPMAGATNASVLVQGVQFDDAGDYFVTVSNLLGTATSSTAVLTVRDGPILLARFDHEWRYEASGSDQGTEWRGAGFDDSAWPAGPGSLGFPESETLPPPELIRTVLPRNVGGVTYYFRTEFFLPGNPGDFELVFKTLIDDGALFYLNGEEILRVGLDPGLITSGTLAARSIGNASFEVFTMARAPGLRTGSNVLAVEVHQVSGLSSDVVLGLELVANPVPPTTIRILREPEALVVEEFKEALLSVEYQGSRERVQWFKDDIPVPGATESVLAIPSTRLADEGLYHVVLSNSVNVVTSAVVRLTVIEDVAGPVPLVGDGREAMDTIRVSFDEAIRPESATNVLNYTLTNTLGGTLSIWSAELVEGTNVVLMTEERVTLNNYLVVMQGVEDVPAGNVMVSGAAVPVSMRLEMVDFGAQWKFYDPFPGIDDPDLGSAWREVDYDTSAWGTGQGAFVFGAVDLPAGLSSGTSLSGGVITTYFRHSMERLESVSPLGGTVTLRHLQSDGGVYYLNGEEVYRDNMPEGPVSYITLASSSYSIVQVSERIGLPLAVARTGGVLGVEMHGSAQLSRERAFAAQLEVELDSFALGPVLITEDPADRVVEEGGSVEFAFRGVGAAHFQWYRDGVAVPLATNATHLIEVAPVGFDGSLFSVVAGNATHSATSGVARLGVVADFTPPVVVSAEVTGLRQVVVTFSERVGPSGLMADRYQVISRSGEDRGVASVERVDDFRVRLITVAAPQMGDIVRVADVADASAAGNVMEGPVSWFIGFPSEIVPIDAVWRYDASDVDLGIEWREPGFDDQDWSFGPALLGEESGVLPEPLQTFVPAGPVTAYFRTRFSFPGDGAGILFRLRVIVDDGAVFYLNGVEFHRLRVPGGQDFFALANGSVGDAGYEGPFALALPSIVPGDNLLAVEVHQSTFASSDMVLGVELSMDEVVSRELIIPPRPVLNIVREGTRAVLTWTAEGFLLERTISLDGPWVAFPASVQSPFTQAISRTRNFFFRLREAEPQ